MIVLQQPHTSTNLFPATRAVPPQFAEVREAQASDADRAGIDRVNTVFDS